MLRKLRWPKLRLTCISSGTMLNLYPLQPNASSLKSAADLSMYLVQILCDARHLRPLHLWRLQTSRHYAVLNACRAWTKNTSDDSRSYIRSCTVTIECVGSGHGRVRVERLYVVRLVVGRVRKAP